MVGVALWAAISITGAQAGTVIGNGTGSCGQWTKDQQDDFFALIDEAWLAGFLSSYSVYNNDKIDLPDAGAKKAWVSNYCLSHPLDPIYTASDQLIIELQRRASQR